VVGEQVDRDVALVRLQRGLQVCHEVLLAVSGSARSSVSRARADPTGARRRSAVTATVCS
jgi:hypothetical protein